MPAIIATISILVITAVVRLLNRILPFSVCPICAGVAGTWLWMLAGMLSGQLPTTDYRLLTAILMGGSVIGASYELEKRFPQARLTLLWKTLFIAAGFAAAYGLLMASRLVLAAGLGSAMLIAALFAKNADKKGVETENPNVKKIKKEMEKCC